MNGYCGHPLQTRGAEQYVLQGGKGDGMHFVYVRNGMGLEAWISLDRCADLSRVAVNGNNIGFFSPCGYVAPQYYDKTGAEFLRSFTAGFFTTCGLTTVGGADADGEELLPMHGTVSNQPATLCAVEEQPDGLHVRTEVRDAVLFGRKLVLRREYVFSYAENVISVRDSIRNDGDEISPLMVLYHCNMGYPLLSEKSIVRIPHDAMRPRNDRAASQQAAALTMEQPQAGYEECCYYYDVKESGGKARVGIFQPEIGTGLVMSFDRTELPCFTEWKMMGKQDYVLGLEPGNCLPDGRLAMREAGTLRSIAPDETVTQTLQFRFVTDQSEFESSFGN